MTELIVTAPLPVPELVILPVMLRLVVSNVIAFAVLPFDLIVRLPVPVRPPDIVSDRAAVFAALLLIVKLSARTSARVELNILLPVFAACVKTAPAPLLLNVRVDPPLEANV